MAIRFPRRFFRSSRPQTTRSFLKRHNSEADSEQFVSRRHLGSDSLSAQSTAVIEDRLRAGTYAGEAMDHETQSTMEDSFGTDFSHVRIHTDGEAIELNRQLRAQAFAFGEHIYFNQGQYAPGTDEGNSLLAHELTHVVQQRSGAKHIQTRAMPGFSGTTVGEVQADIMGSLQRSELSAREELVPNAQTPGVFPGYSLEYEALARALLHTTAAVIVEDRSGRFHAFAVNWPLRSSRQSDLRIAPVEAQNDFAVIRWVNLFQDQDLHGRTWQERVENAEAMHRAYEEGNIDRGRVEAAYVSLLRDALSLGANEVHVMSSLEDREPGKVHFFLELDHAQAIADAQRLPTTAEGDSNPGGELQQPVTVMGPLAFHEESAVFTRAVFLHELEHMRHQLRSQELCRQWLAYRQRRLRQRRQPEDFRIWLYQEVGRHRISDEDYAVARQFASATASNANTETLAHEAAFENSFHLLPVRSLRENLAFHELYFMIDYSMSADPQVRQQVYARVQAYYCLLDEAHRHWFDDYVASQVSEWGDAVERFGEATQRQGAGAAALGRFRGFSRLAEFRDSCSS